MIIDEKIQTTVSYLNIEHYRVIGYIDIKCNQKIEILVSDLPIESNLKINVKCDICGIIKLLSYQKYNKNIRNYNIYCCSTSCSQFKNKATLNKLYGSENFNRSDENKLKTKEKYDKITEEIEKRGYIKCSKCGVDNDLTNYLKNVNNRYKSICKSCRLKQIVSKRRSKDMSVIYKLQYKKNIHIYTWRNLLGNYLRRKNILKSDRTFNLLKYTHLDLKIHLESLFVDDMSWDNYGKIWQIDHIIPVSAFRDDVPAYIVNCLDNLRPLNKIYNNIKSDNLDDAGFKILDNYKTYLKIKI